MHRQWNQEQVSWKAYRHRLCQDDVWKTKVQQELNLTKEAKNNRKDFYWYVSQKRKVKDDVPLLISKTGKLSIIMRKSLRYSTAFLTQSSMATSLPTLLKWDRLQDRLGEQSPSHCKRRSGS